METVTGYDSQYAFLPEYLFHVHLTYFTYDWENKNSPLQNKKQKNPLKENILTHMERCTHTTHTSSHTFSLGLFSEFMPLNTIKFAEKSMCVCVSVCEWYTEEMKKQYFAPKAASKQLREIIPFLCCVLNQVYGGKQKFHLLTLGWEGLFHKWVNGHLRNVVSG